MPAVSNNLRRDFREDLEPQRTVSLGSRQTLTYLMNAPGFGVAALFGASLVSAHASVVDWMPFQPGAAKAAVVGTGIALTNKAIHLDWRLGAQPSLYLRDNWTAETLKSSAEPFVLTLRSGEKRVASQFKTAAPIRVTSTKDGKSAETTLTDSKTGLKVAWKISLRNDSNYIRTEVSLTPTTQDVDVAKVELLNLNDAHATVSGNVSGSPIVDGEIFFGQEHPMAVSEVKDSIASSGVIRKLPFHQGQTTVYSSVLGVTPAGQLRRGFLRYVERERARAYKPFLHYNSWYDLGYFNRYTSDQCVERINTYADELGKKRGVQLSSFLFDDGWDDTKTVWEFNSGFPQGFYPLKKAAETVGAGPGAWLSPWGGYSTPREERLKTGAKAGLEIDSEGYALSGPKYYDRFRQVCLDLVGKYGVNQFKFDGTGSPDKQYPGSHFGSDFEAAIQLIQDLRAAKPGLFINLTTGTWPSPFWTRYADSIWRGGYDHNFAGVGTNREKWITYRDGDTFHGVVQRGPLYPLNSLMLHGLIYAQYANNLKTDPGNDFRNEIRSYFGNGTQLQEMYITPTLLSKQNWDDLAESAKWSQANGDVLVDTHWVGGDPLKLEVYGWGSWSKRKGILVLRNPNSEPQAFSIDPQLVFELPKGAKGTYSLKSPYSSDVAKPAIEVKVGESKVVTLAPFEVLVLEGDAK